MPSPFPGMDPYLERKGFWSEVHAGLIGRIQWVLAPQLLPKYRVSIERSNYSVMLGDVEPLGKPDVIVFESPNDTSDERNANLMQAALATPHVAILPMAHEFEQGYLTIKDTVSKQVVTIIELLSHANKQGVRGREQYQKKRDEILASETNLVEIDLLRAGTRPPVELDDDDDYSILVSRRPQRPLADVYLFNIRDRIPIFPIPLKPKESEPTLDLNTILSDLYDTIGYDMSIDYSQRQPRALTS